MEARREWLGPRPGLLAHHLGQPRERLRRAGLTRPDALEQRQPEQVLTVPQQAVQRDQGGAFVLVVGADSKVELRRVQVARNDLGLAVVADGLAEGENVIVEGVNKVRPGIVVDAAVATGG